MTTEHTTPGLAPPSPQAPAPLDADKADSAGEADRPTPPDSRVAPSLPQKADILSQYYLKPESALIPLLIEATAMSPAARKSVFNGAVALAEQARARPGSMLDQFLNEYGLSSEEGVTLMRLCEALIRTPDGATATQLIRDKLPSGKWLQHFGEATAVSVNASTLGLSFSAAWLEATGGARAKNLLARLGDPVLRRAMVQGMRLMGGHFVLGRTIEEAIERATRDQKEETLCSYDMLGEAAHTMADAERYFEAYRHAVEKLADSENRLNRPKTSQATSGISVKLSALHPRYEYNMRHECVPHLIKKISTLAELSMDVGLGLTIDAEEADRLEVSLLVLEGLLQEPRLSDWDGLGFVVQAYQRRASVLIDYIADRLQQFGRKINIRLVKGAYWDYEIKRAQELGLDSYPVFTRKENTDISYLACARRLFSQTAAIYPQFATHNAHTIKAIEAMAEGRPYEFQRLHGMGDIIHDIVHHETGVKSRIYAPVGRHKDLLPYLVRRLLENGANSSFVNQLIDLDQDVRDIVRDPISIAAENASKLDEQSKELVDSYSHEDIPSPTDLFSGTRQLAAGIDLTQASTARQIAGLSGAAGSRGALPVAAPIINGKARDTSHGRQDSYDGQCYSPIDGRQIGYLRHASQSDIDTAIAAARAAQWGAQTPPKDRASCLERAADLLIERQDILLGLCVEEAGKSYHDALAELREAVDFCRYYAAQCQSAAMVDRVPLGLVACISPWNFPLAIFLGQITAALAAGNCVIAKPAEQTPLIASEAIKILHEAELPAGAVHLLIGSGAKIGRELIEDSRIDGVCFTGSTATAKAIAASLARTSRSLIPYIAETGGVNAMIIDSTALLEQAVTDLIASAFQSAGQRCSACRILCVQDDIADDFIKMLDGAVKELALGDPRSLATDIGPVIDAGARHMLTSYIEDKKSAFKVLCSPEIRPLPEDGFYVAPIAFEIEALSDVAKEVFGPVLHVLRYDQTRFDELIEDINALGYGLTMGLHTRIDNRMAHIAAHAEVGNLYVNRNQIGAVVGVQPFGGHGLSGTGPKAGGPHYLRRLSVGQMPGESAGSTGGANATRPAGLATPVNPAAGKSSMSDTPVCAALVSPAPDFAALTLSPEDLDMLARAKAAMTSVDWTNPDILIEAVIEALFADGSTAANELAVFARSLLSVPLASFHRPQTLPGPTGESNTLTLTGRGVLLCLGGIGQSLCAEKQVLTCLRTGNSALMIAPAGNPHVFTLLIEAVKATDLPNDLLTRPPTQDPLAWLEAPIDGMICDSDERAGIAAAVMQRNGPIIPTLSITDDLERYCLERVVSINTTAAGGNTQLLTL